MKPSNTIPLLSLVMLFLYGQLNAQFPQMGNDIHDGIWGDGYFGASVSLSANGKVLAVGSPYIPGGDPSSNRGMVYVYQWNGNTWLQKGNSFIGDVPLERLGYAVSLSANGNILAISALSVTGRVSIYEWNGSAWLQKGSDINGELSGDYSGNSVSLSANGNIVAIGAYGNNGTVFNSDCGHVRIHEWDGTAWVQKGGDIDGEAANDNSGWSVSLSSDGNILAVGAKGNDGNGSNAGHVRIYEWNGTAWGQKGNDIDGEAANDNFGYSVNLSSYGNILAVGAIGNDGNGADAGHVRIYQWNGTAWAQKGNDIDGEAAGDKAGNAVYLSANGITLAVGAPTNDANGISAGHTRIYGWNGAAWTQKGNDIDGEWWGDASGYSLCLSGYGDILAVGSPYHVSGFGRVRTYNISSVYGYAYQDFNQNCTKDTLEVGLANRLLTLNPGNILLQTNSDGSWFIDSLPIGTYTITADTSSAIWQLTCPVTQSFTVTNPNNITQAPSFGYISNYPCSAPNVSIHAPFLRPGFSDQYVYVRACNANTASGMMDSVFLVVELDALLTVDGSSWSYTNLGNNQYRINIGHLYPGQCIDFWFSTTLSANAVLGQTLCMTAELYPVDSCALDSIPNSYLGGVSPCALPWDHSSLSVDGACVGDSVRFVIYNSGSSDMDCFAPVRLYLDGQFISLDSIQLTSGDSVVFMFYGNGTWHLEADQHPLHPGNSHPNATVENCGIGAWTPNLVNIFPLNDADPFTDIYCGLITSSYDPNDKTGFPLGVGSSHDIHPNQGINYVIRFQNTGTDTAFSIVVRDTLPMDLDIFSVQSGVSSHNYSFKIYGNRILEWAFNNILLPDSNVNEPASHGFLTFKVKQMPNLPNGTVIENSAAIYFDFNPPVITNTSQHTINDSYILSNTTFIPNIKTNNLAKIFPNPTTGTINIQIDQAFKQANIVVFNTLGQAVFVMQTAENLSRLDLPNEAGVYFVKVDLDGETAVYKVVKE